jgi:hypothetical protein
MVKKIVSLVDHRPLVGQQVLEELKAGLSNLGQFDTKEDYRHFIKLHLQQLDIRSLPQSIQKPWDNLVVGFHTHEIFKIENKVFTVQLKIYLLKVNNEAGNQGAIMVAAHSHKELPQDIRDKTYQAVTFVVDAQGEVEASEEIFGVDPSNPNFAIFQATVNRDIKSANQDENHANIHNFTVKGRGQVAIAAVYIAERNPNDVYLPELITTQERAIEIADRIALGLTPYQPTPDFGDTFVVSDALKGDLDPKVLQAIRSVTIEATQAKVRERTFNVDLNNYSTLEDSFSRLGLEHEFRSESVQVSLKPLLEALLAGKVTHFIVSWKPETSSCEESSKYRVSLEVPEQIGIPLSNEVRFNLRSHTSKKDKVASVEIYISPAHKQAGPKPMLSSKQLDASEIGVTRLAINPFNVVDGLVRNAESVLKKYPVLNFHLDPEIYRSSFVSNNGGGRHISVSADTQAYFDLLKVQLTSLREAGYKVNLFENPTSFVAKK